MMLTSSDVKLASYSQLQLLLILPNMLISKWTYQSFNFGEENQFHTSFRFRALYKGLVPKVLRLGPGAGIMMIVYENVHGYLTKRFPDN